MKELRQELSMAIEEVVLNRNMNITEAIGQAVEIMKYNLEEERRKLSSLSSGFRDINLFVN